MQVMIIIIVIRVVYFQTVTLNPPIYYPPCENAERTLLLRTKFRQKTKSQVREYFSVNCNDNLYQFHLCTT